MPSQRDPWLDNEDEEQVQAPEGEPARASGTPREMLWQIARDRTETTSGRVQALKLLDDAGHGEDYDPASLELADWVNDLSGDALDKELEGFFNPGWVDPPPPPPPTPGSEEHIEQEVESRTRRAIKAWAKSKGVRLEPMRAKPERVAAEAPPKPVSEPQRPAEDELAQRRAKLVRLDNGEVYDLAAPMTEEQRRIVQSKMVRQQARDQIREEKRKRHPFAQHIPKGMDPASWDRCWH